MSKTGLLCAASALAVTVVAAAPGYAATVLRIESWRAEDQALWDEKILPVFEAANPDIDVQFTPTAPTEYNAALNARLEGGSAGDLITCRPFDASLALYDKGHLAALDDLAGLSHFSAVAKAAWSTDDGAHTFCVPMASVIHGFMYNKDAFKELGLTVPTTESEFFATLDAIKADGTYIPMAMGVADQWEAATMGFQNVGPNFWKGEAGRAGLLDGTAKLSDTPYVKTLAHLARWGAYLGDGYQAQGYSDSQNLFTLGRAAIYPTGSWEIAGFMEAADSELGACPAPKPDHASTCYISDHTDIGMGMNAASENKEAARKFLDWMSSAEFAALFGDAVPGFFPLSDHAVTLKNPLAAEFVSWRGKCESSIRNSYHILSRGEPNLENDLWAKSVAVISGKQTPEDAAASLQEGLAKWYAPQQ